MCQTYGVQVALREQCPTNLLLYIQLRRRTIESLYGTIRKLLQERNRENKGKEKKAKLKILFS